MTCTTCNAHDLRDFDWCGRCGAQAKPTIAPVATESASGGQEDAGLWIGYTILIGVSILAVYVSVAIAIS